jgi:hypothetical protein
MVMMQEYLASFEINVNTTTIWRYLTKRIARLAGQGNSVECIQALNTDIKKVETFRSPYYQQNSTDKSLQKSTLAKLNDLSNAENEF